MVGAVLGKGIGLERSHQLDDLSDDLRLGQIVRLLFFVSFAFGDLFIFGSSIDVSNMYVLSLSFLR